MFEVRKSAVFDAWLASLDDSQVRERILFALQRLSEGHARDVRGLGGRLAEVRLHMGPGFRLYFARSTQGRINVLVGGTKRTQSRDMLRARKLMAAMED